MEIWERFAYFGMLSLLILYLTKSYGVSDADGPPTEHSLAAVFKKGVSKFSCCHS